MPNDLEPNGPPFMTCGELIHQDEQFVKEYATHYNIPIDLPKSKMLERICQLHPGAAPTIPILPHLTFNRVNGGRVRLTGKTAIPIANEPTTGLHADTSKSMPPVIESGSNSGQPCLPHSVQAMKADPKGKSPSTTLPEESESPAKSIRQRGPLDLEHDLEIVARFPSPYDTYSPGPSPPPSRGPGLDQLSQKSRASTPKPKMQFVYPPIPRHSARHQDNPEGATRAFSPGGTWLDKMYLDLEHGRAELLSELEEAKVEVREALYEATRAEIAMKREVTETKSFIKWLEKVVSTEWTSSIIAKATRRAEEGTSDSDPLSDGDDQSDGGDNDGGHPKPCDPVKPSSPQVSPSPPRADSQPGTQKQNSIQSMPRTLETFEAPLVDDHIQGASRSISPPAKNSIEDHVDKRSYLHFSGPSDNLSSPPVTPPNNTSSSRKRSRDDDSKEGSEQEVEHSVRLTGVEGSRKKRRPNSSGSSDNPASTHNGALDSSVLTRQFLDSSLNAPVASDNGDLGHSSDYASSDNSDNLKDGVTWSEYQENADNEGYEASDDENPGYFDGEDGGDKYELEDEAAYLDDKNVPSSFYSQPIERSSSPPIAGPSNPRQVPRPLTRARERLRPTASGGVEAYIFDEGPEYELRLAHEQEVIAAWRKYIARESSYPFTPEFEIIRGAPVPPVSFVGDPEYDGDDNKGK